jgi:competence protein ComFC
MTIKTRLISMILPHYCCSCGEIGDILCVSCRYDIESEKHDRCLSCLEPVRSGACSRCKLPYQRGWFVGERVGSLARLVDASKFLSVRRGCDVQAELLGAILPALPSGAVFIPVPTIAKHRRTRGYGHAERIARALARQRGCSTDHLVERRVQHVQHGATRRQRHKQAAESYVVHTKLDPEVTYVIVDDVYTTGATIKAVAESLRLAGATTIWVAVTSRQPLDAKG